MTKTEMALWLAGFIGWERGKDYSIGNEDIVPLIYSPDGFFLVWNAASMRFPYLEIAFSITAYDSICCVFTNNDAKWMFNQFGKDRYEAFYRAVYEARGYSVFHFSEEDTR